MKTWFEKLARHHSAELKSGNDLASNNKRLYLVDHVLINSLAVAAESGNFHLQKRYFLDSHHG
jgi:hypothetical protein